MNLLLASIAPLVVLLLGIACGVSAVLGLHSTDGGN